MLQWLSTAADVGCSADLELLYVVLFVFLLLSMGAGWGTQHEHLVMCYHSNISTLTHA